MPPTRPLLLYTDHQTAGRGTRGRTWLQQPGRDVALTVALPADTPGLLDARLSLAAGVLVARAAELALRDAAAQSGEPQRDQSGWRLKLKWPNDLLIYRAGSLRKLGGILAERSSGVTFIGVGINVNSAASDYPAELGLRMTTLSDVLGRELERTALTGAVAETLLLGLTGGIDYDALMQEWQARDATRGQRYNLTRAGQQQRVEAESVDSATGALICRSATGESVSIISVSDLEELASS